MSLEWQETTAGARWPAEFPVSKHLSVCAPISLRSSTKDPLTSWEPPDMPPRPTTAGERSAQRGSGQRQRSQPPPSLDLSVFALRLCPQPHSSCLFPLGSDNRLSSLHVFDVLQHTVHIHSCMHVSIVLAAEKCVSGWKENGAQIFLTAAAEWNLQRRSKWDEAKMQNSMVQNQFSSCCHDLPKFNVAYVYLILFILFSICFFNLVLMRMLYGL